MARKRGHRVRVDVQAGARDRLRPVLAHRLLGHPFEADNLDVAAAREVTRKNGTGEARSGDGHAEPCARLLAFGSLAHGVGCLVGGSAARRRRAGAVCSLRLCSGAAHCTKPPRAAVASDSSSSASPREFLLLTY